MKKSQEDIEKLKNNLPYGYAEKIQKNLSAKKHNYSIETIKKVASGVRSNVLIELELTALAMEYNKALEEVKKNIKSLRK